MPVMIYRKKLTCVGIKTAYVGSHVMHAYSLFMHVCALKVFVCCFWCFDEVTVW